MPTIPAASREEGFAYDELAIRSELAVYGNGSA